VTQGIAIESGTLARSGLAPAAAARLARGSAAALIIFVISAGLAYCAQLAIARMIGPEAYGQYAYVLAWVTVLAYASALGFDVSLLRFVPAYLSRHDLGLIRGVLRLSQRAVALAGIGVAALGVGFVEIWSGDLPPALARTFIIGFALVPLWALLWIRCSIARAFGGVVSALTPERIVRDALLIGLLGIAGPVLGWRIGAPMAMAATVAGSAVALLLITLAARRLRPAELARITPAQANSVWFRAAAPLVLIGTVEPLMNRLGVMLLGWMGDITGAGVYAIVFNVAFLAMLPRTAVNILFAPKAAELFARNDMAGLQQLILRTSVWMVAGSLCIAVPLWLLASPILALFGPGFAAGATALRVLLVGQVMIAGAGSQLYLMTMTGHERSAALLIAGSAVFSVVLGGALVAMAGVLGAAVASVIAFVVWNVTMGVFVRRKLRLVPGVLSGLTRAAGRVWASEVAFVDGQDVAGLEKSLASRPAFRRDAVDGPKD